MKKTEYTAKMGVMLALLCALSFLESRICASFPYGIRIGFANIIIMLAIFSLETKSAFALSILKSAFVLLTRGPVAFFMSLCGGIFSLAIILVMLKTKRASIMLCSVLGAISHNLAQLCVCALIVKNIYTFFYAPLLVLSGIGAGIITGLCICAINPYLSKKKLSCSKKEGTFTDG